VSAGAPLRIVVSKDTALVPCARIAALLAVVAVYLAGVHLDTGLEPVQRAVVGLPEQNARSEEYAECKESSHGGTICSLIANVNGDILKSSRTIHRGRAGSYPNRRFRIGCRPSQVRAFGSSSSVDDHASCVRSIRRCPSVCGTLLFPRTGRTTSGHAGVPRPHPRNRGYALVNIRACEEPFLDDEEEPDSIWLRKCFDLLQFGL